jgi:hypothetical protein
MSRVGYDTFAYSIVQEHRTSSTNRRNKFLFFSDLFAQVDVKGNGTSPSAAGGTLPDLKSTRHTRPFHQLLVSLLSPLIDRMSRGNL